MLAFTVMLFATFDFSSSMWADIAGDVVGRFVYCRLRNLSFVIQKVQDGQSPRKTFVKQHVGIRLYLQKEKHFLCFFSYPFLFFFFLNLSGLKKC